MFDPLPKLYGPEHWDLVDRLVPDHGAAETVQGELLRAALRVSAEHCRNGSSNWLEDPDYFDGFVAYLSAHLCDGTFDAETEQSVRSILLRAQTYGKSDSAHRSREESEALSRDLDTIEQLSAAWCMRHPELIPRKARAEY
jgi:hypothetical protein